MADNWTVAGDTGQRHLGDAEGDAAIAALAKAAKKNPSAENEAGLALAYFQCERYELAAEHYRAALDLEAGNEEWSAMLALARANAAAEIDVPVPDVHFHDPAVLLAAPEVRPGAIPERPAPVSPPGRLRRARLVAGRVVGPPVSIAFGGLILAWGRIAGYRDEVWTNWYRRAGLARRAHPRVHARAAQRPQPEVHLPAAEPDRVPGAGADASARGAALPHGRRILEQPERPEGGRGRHALPPQRGATPRSGPRRASA